MVEHSENVLSWNPYNKLRKNFEKCIKILRVKNDEIMQQQQLQWIVWLEMLLNSTSNSDIGRTLLLFFHQENFEKPVISTRSGKTVGIFEIQRKIMEGAIKLADITHHSGWFSLKIISNEYTLWPWRWMHLEYWCQWKTLQEVKRGLYMKVDWNLLGLFIHHSWLRFYIST